MKQHCTTHWFIALALSAALARADSPPNRPDLTTAKPIATCKLQSIASPGNRDDMPSPVGFYSRQPPADDPLANYERTPLGNWQIPAAADHNDPWLRLLLMAPNRPLVIDVAVFIDGKSFRHAREAWIDDVLAAAKPGPAKVAVEVPAGNNEPADQGTNTTSPTSKDAAPADAEDDSPSDDAVTPGVQAQPRQAPTMRARLTNYLAAAGAEVDRDEIGWLIAEWGAGPAVVVLDASQSWQRAGMAPLVAYLDRDADGSLSAAEIEQADGMLRRADVDGNDVVDVSEIRRATKHPPAVMGATGHSLVVLLDANTDWEALEANLKRVYVGKLDGSANLDARELGAKPADVTLRVDLGAGGDQENDQALSLVSVSSELATNRDAVSATTDVIAMDLGGDYIEFSAAQAAADENSDIAASQLAIGAVIDGNPLLRLLDRDQDGRLTLRERKELGGLLAALDRDTDGNLSASEIPVPIRLAITLGPQVHQLLAKPTGAARTIASRDVPKAPDWFLSMDKNSDSDLSRGEFLGTTEQFRQFDENGDQLLSIAEALKVNPGE